MQGYTIVWPTSAVCKPIVLPASSCPAVPAVPDPKPSTELLMYQEMEMGALICYNMATADKTQGCAASRSRVIPALPLTQNAAKHHDLRCVF